MSKFLAIFAAFAAIPAMAYPISENAPVMGFYVAAVESTAPVLVSYGWNGKLTPEQYVEKKCPGAKVTEINMAATPTYANGDTKVQIVFSMPRQGCLETQ